MCHTTKIYCLYHKIPLYICVCVNSWLLPCVMFPFVMQGWHQALIFHPWHGRPNLCAFVHLCKDMNHSPQIFSSPSNARRLLLRIWIKEAEWNQPTFIHMRNPTQFLCSLVLEVMACSIPLTFVTLEIVCLPIFYILGGPLPPGISPPDNETMKPINFSFDSSPFLISYPFACFSKSTATFHVFSMIFCF